MQVMALLSTVSTLAMKSLCVAKSMRVCCDIRVCQPLADRDQRDILLEIMVILVLERCDQTKSQRLQEQAELEQIIEDHSVMDERSAAQDVELHTAEEQLKKIKGFIKMIGAADLAIERSRQKTAKLAEQKMQLEARAHEEQEAKEHAKHLKKIQLEQSELAK
jgi:hypothetical protein